MHRECKKTKHQLITLAYLVRKWLHVQIFNGRNNFKEKFPWDSTSWKISLFLYRLWLAPNPSNKLLYFFFISIAYYGVCIPVGFNMVWHSISMFLMFLCFLNHANQGGPKDLVVYIYLFGLVKVWLWLLACKPKKHLFRFFWFSLFDFWLDIVTRWYKQKARIKTPK